MAQFVHKISIVLALTLAVTAFVPRSTTTTRPMSTRLSMSSDSLTFNPQETALVLIEYQNEFTTSGGKLHDAVKDCMAHTNMMDNSVKVLQACRQAGVTIVHCPINFEAGHREISNEPYGILKGVKDGAAFVSGDWGAEICNSMTPDYDKELVVKGKSGLCGFGSTNLDFLLRQANAKTIILAGFLTNCCVESTMRTAYELGYQVYTLKDCVAATSIAAQEATLEHNFGMFSIPTSSDEVIQALKVPAAVA